LPVEALQSLSNCYGAPGRLERVQNDHGLNVFVDYAHTPDALENVLRALKSLDFGKVVAVFGCGGNRDRAKRPLMAEAVAKWAEVAVLTSDNPRHEDPLTIMEDAKPGLEKAVRAVLEQDRRKAIRLALDEIGPNDALLIAGKGHETYQQIGDVKHPFNDVTVVKELLA
jgi:UDP-N-acetylmuramoyl-L-alanyl-D-glutamate--2,6-diaminopimelate ligase